MDSKQTFSEALKETADGFLYTFDSNFALDLMNLESLWRMLTLAHQMNVLIFAVLPGEMILFSIL